MCSYFAIGKKNCLKALRFDKDGFLLATKKLLPDMVFQWPKSKEEIQDITPQQVRWLLEGLSIEQKKAHKTVRIRPEDTCF